MRGLSVVMAVAAVACVCAFPSQFYSVSLSNGAGCTGTVSSTSYYGIDTCIVESSSTAGYQSIKYTVSTSNTVVTTRYTATKDCSGAAIVNNVTYANNQCDNSGGTYAKYVFPVAAEFWSTTSYGNSDCSGTPTSGPSFNLLGGCIGSTGNYARYDRSGGSLAVGRYTTADCSGDATQSFEIPKGCLSQASTYYDFSAAAASAPQFVVAAVAVVMAVASFRL